MTKTEAAKEDVEGDYDAADLKPYHLATWQEGGKGQVPNGVNKFTNPMSVHWPGMNFLDPSEMVSAHIIMNDSKLASRRKELKSGCVRGNATKLIFWEPSKVKVAMITAGGLCPGLNSIIREVTNCLVHEYGVNDVLGFESGWNGLSDPDCEPIELTVDLVREIHLKGGSVLKAGRGGFDAPKICEKLKKLGITFLFVIGGDGTQFAGNLLFEELQRINLPVSIIGVPKSIDNDVLFFDKTFGFDSAVATAQGVIRNAYVEASSCDKAVGIVKLMGRDAGFIPQNATIASTLVDCVLIPEIKYKLEDVMAHVDATLARKNHMVMIVAEGAGQEFVETGESDATGHAKYGDIGIFMRDAVNKHLKPQGGRSFYIDPSYIIRSCPIMPNDHIYCTRLAHDAVHTAMRGYTGVCIGAINNVISIVPSIFVASGKRVVKLKSSNWQLAVASSKMPASLAGLA